MPRPYWRGYLRLSLVTCPIVLFPATTSAERTHFHRINKKNGHRLRQQMVDESSGRVVEKENIGRGYELGKGRYVAIDEEELGSVKLESTRTIEIDSFVPIDEIDRRYLAKPYYVAPSGGQADEAFTVIRDAMKNKGRAAIGRIVLAHRELALAIEPLGKGMLANTLHYDYEVREEKAYFAGIKTPRVQKDMIELAEHILSAKSAKFDPTKFKDRYESALKALVKRKAAGKTIEPPAPPKEKDNVIDLMEALKRSLSGRSALKSAGEKQNRKPKKRKAA